MQMTRRDLLKMLAIAPVLVTAVCHAGNQGRISLASLRITVPAWLFDTKSKEKTKVRAMTIEEDKASNEFVVLFESGRQLRLKPETSVQLLVQRNAGRPTRQSMLLKRVISYSLDSLFSRIAGNRNPQMGASLRHEFDLLQAEQVLEALTVAAIYDLLVKLDKRSTISSVSWNSSQRRLIIR